MHKAAFVMTLRPGAYPGYKKAHDECWPELLDFSRSCGVSMVIYKRGDQLFVFATTPTEQHWLKSREGPLVEKWNTFMTQYLETDEDGSIRFEEVETAFTSGDFADE